MLKVPGTVPDSLDHAGRLFPERTALVHGVCEVDYATLSDCVKNVAASLAVHVQLGGRVALHLPRCAEYIVYYLAIQWAGAVVVPLHPDAKKEEIAHDLELTDPDLVVTGESGGPDGLSHLFPGPIVRTPTDAARTGRVPGLGQVPPDGSSTPPRASANDTAVLLATSGSTRWPKRVEHTHRGLLANAEAHRLSVADPGEGGITAVESALAVLPLNFGYCNTVQVVGQIASGGTLVLLEGMFTPTAFARLVQRHRVGSTVMVPSMLRLLTMSTAHRDFDISALRRVAYGGAPMPSGLRERLQECYPDVEFVETYGQTEAGPRITTMRSADRVRHPGSVGRAVPGTDVTIVDSDGKDLPPCSPGEIVVSGPGTMVGYFGDRAGSERVLRAGRLHTGDLGWLDDDGFLYVSGRLRNIAIVNGVNVSLEEVEGVLEEHDGIAEAACSASADERTGERVTAWVVPTRDDVTPEGVRAFCRRRMSGNKVPESIYVVPRLPRTRNGKLARHRLGGVFDAAE